MRYLTFTLPITFLILLPLLVIFGEGMLSSSENLAHIQENVLPRYLMNSLILVLGVGTITMLVGTLAAWLVSIYSFPGRKYIQWALLLPLALPAYVAAFTYTGLLEYAGPAQSMLRQYFQWQKGDYWFPEIRSLSGAIFVLSMVLFPYVYLLALTFFKQSQDMVATSRTLGLSGMRAFFKLGIPAARPAIIAGVMLVLMETLADFGTVQYFAVDTFTTGIYRSWFGLNDYPLAAKLSAMLMVVMLAFYCLERWGRKEAKYTQQSHRGHHLQPLSKMAAAGALLFCLMPLLFGFVIPVVRLVYHSFLSYQHVFESSFWGHVSNTLTVATAAALTATAIAFCFGYILRFRQTPMQDKLIRLSGFGYAIPGSVLAVGVLITFANIDRTLDLWWGTGLLLSGSLVALVFAYVVRFLSLALHSVETGTTKLKDEYEQVSRLAGFGFRSSFHKVYVPLLQPSLAVAFLLVFVECVKELPATLIIRPFNFETLATRAFMLASDELLVEAALPSLMIVGTSILSLAVLITVVRINTNSISEHG